MYSGHLIHTRSITYSNEDPILLVEHDAELTGCVFKYQDRKVTAHSLSVLPIPLPVACLHSLCLIHWTSVLPSRPLLLRASLHMHSSLQFIWRLAPLHERGKLF